MSGSFDPAVSDIDLEKTIPRRLARPEAQPLLDDLVTTARADSLTLVYGAADREHNQAVVLAELIRERDVDVG